MVWVETPTNPLLGIADIAALATLAHEAGALLVVDNTFATPYLQRPLTLGADVVIHSTTKYAGGHSDVVGGAVVVRDLDLAEKVGYHQNAMGAVAGPFDAWLTLRGLKTLAVRMERHCDNAERVVEFLTGRRAGRARLLPGPRRPPRPRGRRAPDGPVRRHGVVPRQGWRGAGAPGLRPGPRSSRWRSRSGGIESLIEHPGRMTHASVAGTDLEVPADLVRLSVGIETVDDLLADLDQALG